MNTSPFASPRAVAHLSSVTVVESFTVTRGFPRAQAPIQEWVPGVSTPEGLILSMSASALAVSAFSDPQLFDRIARGVFGTLTVGVSAAIPVVTLWFGATIGQ